MSRKAGGMFIAVEGIDAVGKRTQSSALSSWLASKKLSVSTLSFPDYGTVLGREIKRFLVGEKDYPQQVRAMLYAANRWERKSDLEATIARCDATVVNRYTGSNLAYGTSNGLDLDWLVNLEVGLPTPDLTLVLDAPATHLKPRRGMNKDTYERNLELQERTRGAYLQLSKKFGWRVVDATKGIDETGALLKAAVSEAFAASGRTV
ncbi:MAG TPA: dTMP kinase [Nitrososphaerales archaeon]|nr:dTMP kinase [Nitrososphaerales archaeon]